jgi:penicillin-binding protein 2
LDISIPNPYDPTKKTIFKDWKVHGWVDMRQGIAESSDEYFYTIGGGYNGQKGLGIANIEKYIRMFGFGSNTGIDLLGEKAGTIPSPEWKAATFKGDPWRIGDTYNSSIGQYGFQVTPIQAVRAVASLANNGTLLRPTVILNNPRESKDTAALSFSADHFQIVKEGMKMSVDVGVAKGLSMPGISVAAKTGTAELGVTKLKVNSWVTGYFPYENPRYAFAVLMERGDRSNTIGATYVMRQLLEWMYINTPQYVK